MDDIGTMNGYTFPPPPFQNIHLNKHYLFEISKHDEHMNFPISNKTKLNQVKSQVTYLYIFILVKLLILNPKYNNFYLRKCLFCKENFRVLANG